MTTTTQRKTNGPNDNVAVLPLLGYHRATTPPIPTRSSTCTTSPLTTSSTHIDGKGLSRFSLCRVCGTTPQLIPTWWAALLCAAHRLCLPTTAYLCCRALKSAGVVRFRFGSNCHHNYCTTYLADSVRPTRRTKLTNGNTPRPQCVQ